MCSLSLAAGIGIKDKCIVENWLDNVANCMMHDSVFKRGGHDDSGLGIKDIEDPVRAELIIFR